MKQINDPNRLQHVLSVPETILKLHHVPSGMLSLGSDTGDGDQSPPAINTTVPTAGLSSSALSSGTSVPSVVAATQFAAGSSNSAAPIEPPINDPPRKSLQLTHSEILQQLAKRQVEGDLQQSQPPAKKPRQERTCRKCANDDCPGKGKVKFCVNPCRDCGKEGKDLTCIGRNPKFKNVKCTEAMARWGKY